MFGRHHVEVAHDMTTKTKKRLGPVGKESGTWTILEVIFF